MADPLSIAASIAGLLTITTRIYSTVKDFASSLADAPKSALSLLQTIEDMKLTLVLFKDLMNELSTLPPEKKAMIRLDHIAITFTHCIATLSELESMVLVDNLSGVWDRLRWTLKEDKLTALLPRLESQKSSLSLMVSVLRW